MKNALFLIPFCLLCSLGLTRCSEEQQTRSNGQSASNETLSFCENIVMDADGFGMEAFRVFVPEGWEFEGGITWTFDETPPQAVDAYTISSPGRQAVVEQFPPIDFFWSDNAGLRNAGSRQGMEIVEPKKAAEFLKEIFFSRFRPDLSKLEIIEEQELPEMADQAGTITRILMEAYGKISPFPSPVKVDATAARIKVTYVEGEQVFIEDSVATLLYITSKVPLQFGGEATLRNWIPYFISFKAPGPVADDHLALYRTITASYRKNPAWAAACTKLGATVARDRITDRDAVVRCMAKIRSGEVEPDPLLLEATGKLRASRDAIFSSRDGAGYAVDTFLDAESGRTVKLPAGYEIGWTDGTTFILGKAADFDPSTGSDRPWRRLDRNQ